MATMNWTRRSFLGTLGAGVVASEFGSLTTLAQGQGPAPNPARDAANVERDVVFGKGGDVELHCDIYKPPAGASKRMANGRPPLPKKPGWIPRYCARSTKCSTNRRR